MMPRAKPKAVANVWLQNGDLWSAVAGLAMLMAIVGLGLAKVLG